MGQVQTRKDKIVGGLTKGVEYLFKKNKIDWIKGTARLAGKGKVVVTEGDAQELHGDGDHRRHRLVRRAACPASTIDRTRIITSDEAIHLKAVPTSIVIMGSGAVGVEFASIYRRFGSEVTIIELLPRLVPVEDEAVSARAREVVQEAGHHGDDRHQGDEGRRRREGRGHRGADARRARRKTAVGRAAAGGDRTWAGDRRARRRRGWAWRWSAATSRWTSSIARRCPNISAIGDVVTLGNGSATRSWRTSRRPKGILVAERIAGTDVKPLNFDHVPGCTYCDPEIGSVGLTEAEAQEARLRRARRLVPVRRARPREDGRRARGLREDRGRRASTTRCSACT